MSEIRVICDREGNVKVVSADGTVRTENEALARPYVETLGLLDPESNAQIADTCEEVHFHDDNTQTQGS